MGVHIVIAGESQCEIFDEICLVADYLSQNLPNFCYERIEKPTIEWETWLTKINMKYKWHHSGSPLVWKELLMKGSKPYYIGGGPEFIEYCHSYYEFDTFLASEKVEGLSRNFAQFKQKIKEENSKIATTKDKFAKPKEKDLVVTIAGVGNPLAMPLISGLMDMALGREKGITKIYIYDFNCSKEFMDFVERECSYIHTDQPTRVVRYVEKIGAALTHTNLLIILDHVPFREDMAIGSWLHSNRIIMSRMAQNINASASRKMYVLFPNVGPACYNATILKDLVNIDKKNIVVATSDLGLEISPIAAEIAEIPLRNMFCPPVWGFVGINHLVDIRTTVHKYNAFEPYKRYTRVKDSSLIVGSLTPELRTMEYLMYFDDSLWPKVVENKAKAGKKALGYNKIIAVLDVVRHWLFERDPKNIVNLGIPCNGSFNLNFTGIFSQPSRFVDGYWIPASDYILPRDPQMNLGHLQQMAKFVMTLNNNDLPKIVPFNPCICKAKTVKIKHVW